MSFMTMKGEKLKKIPCIHHQRRQHRLEKRLTTL